MAIQTTSNLSNAIRTRYGEKYLEAINFRRLYDMFAYPIGREGVEAASWLANTVQVPFMSDMEPGTSTISEVSDVVPSVLSDATSSITTTSRWGALQWSEGLELKAYTNYGEARFAALGKNQAETVDLLAQAQALQGGVIHRSTTRDALDAGTATDRLTDTAMSIIDAKLQSLKCPSYVTPDGQRKMWYAAMHPYAFHDLRLGGNVVSVGQYQRDSILLNFELGEIGSFKLIVTPWAKVFWGAGADNGSAVATTLNGATAALATSIEVASASNMVVGMAINIGTEETGDTHYATNERALITSISGTTIGVAGEAANGGLRFAHASGAAVRNADSVFPVVFGGPQSIAKVYDSDVGEYGEVVGPKRDGVLDQFVTIGWKWYGGYGRFVDGWVLRGEFASSLEA